MKVLILVLALLSVGSCGYVRARVPAPVKTAQPGPPAPLPLANQGYGQAVRVEAEPEPVDSYAPEREAEVARPEVKAPARTYDYIKTRDNGYSRDKYQEELRQEEEEELAAQEASKNAKYNFATAVDDGIQDQSQVRQETRDGHKVTGSYKYSDGFVKRTVHYEADENGYRVVSELTEPIGEGPNIDLKNGKADVHTMAHGIDTQYSVNADEIARSTELPPKMVSGKSRGQIQIPAQHESSYDS